MWSPAHLDNASILRFLCHYIEMLVGSVRPPNAVVPTSGRPGLMLAEMAVTMTLPMVAWMRFRGHAWRSCTEMAASMLLPAAGAIGLLGAGLVTHTGPLMVVEHAAMLASMLIAMLLRREEYTGRHRRHEQPATLTRPVGPHQDGVGGLVDVGRGPLHVQRRILYMRRRPKSLAAGMWPT